MRRSGCITTIAALLLALQTLAAQAFPVSGWSRFYEGMEYATGYATSPRLMRAFAIRVSLKNPDVGVYASHSNGSGSYEVTRQTTAAFLSEHGMEAAINASFFNAGLSPNTDVWGLLVSNGSVVSAPDYAAPFNSYISFASSKSAIVSAGNSVPTGCYNAVAGAERLLTNGSITSSNADVQPRTGVGLSADGKYAILLCVDGRQPGWSEGVSHPELAQWLLDFGAWNAILLDGGGSTTMVRADVGTVNSPSDGYPRAVGANLGFSSVAANNVGPDSVSWDANRVDVIVRGAGNHVFQKVWPGPGQPWTGWNDLGSATLNTPACSSWGTNRLDIFCRGTDNKLKHRAFNGQWNAWEDLGGTLTSGPAAVSWGTNRIDVFVRAANNNIDQIYWDGTWHGWYNLQGVATSNPAVCSWGVGRLDLFVRSSDNALWWKHYDGAWSGWSSVGGVLSSEPAAVSWGPNRVDVVVRGSNDQISHISYNGSTWSGWENLGGTWASAPSISSRGVGSLDVYVRGTDDHLYQKSYSGGAWGGWVDLGPYFE